MTGWVKLGLAALVALPVATGGCHSTEPESVDPLTGNWRAASPVTPATAPGAMADSTVADSVRYLMSLSLDGADVVGRLFVQSDSTVQRWLVHGYLHAGSPDELLLEYRRGECSFYGDFIGEGTIDGVYRAEHVCDGATDSLTFKPANLGWVDGKVTDDGEAAGAKAIYLYPSGADWLDDGVRTETDVDGRFIFTGVQPGNYTVKALLYCENDDSEKAIRVEKGQLTTATFSC